MTRMIGWQTAMGKDESGRQEMAETKSGNDGCGGGQWRRWMTIAADDDSNNGNGGQQQRQQQTTTTANNDSGGQ